MAFDLILLSAVWMHVPPSSRARAFRKLITLLKPGGLLAMTLRQGPVDPDRDMHEVSVDELRQLARGHGAWVEAPAKARTAWDADKILARAEKALSPLEVTRQELWWILWEKLRSRPDPAR